MAVVETGSLFSFAITSLVRLTRICSLAGFLDNSKSLLGIAAGLGLARPFRMLYGPGNHFCVRLIGWLPFGKIGQIIVLNGVIGAICS